MSFHIPMQKVVPTDSEQAIEQLIQNKGLTAPRISPADLDANIIHTAFVTHISAGGQVLRWCIITTKSGFAVTGDPSVAVSPANDDVEIGQRVAFLNAKGKMWALMGYHLKEQLAANRTPVN